MNTPQAVERWRWPQDPGMAGRAPRRSAQSGRFLRLVQVLPRGAAGGVDDRDAGDALSLRLDRRRARRGDSVLDLLRAAADVPRETARAGRLRLARRVVGARQGAADRLHQEDHRFSARGNNCAVCHTTNYRAGAEREPGVRQRRAGTHAEPRGVLPLPRRLREGSALQRRQPDARDQSRDRPAARRSARVPLPDHPDDQETAARTRDAVRVDLSPRLSRLGPRPRRLDESHQVLHDQAVRWTTASGPATSRRSGT